MNTCVLAAPDSPDGEPSTSTISQSQTATSPRLLYLRALLPTRRPLALAAIVGMLSEAIAVSWRSPNLYDTDFGTCAFGIAYLIWFWITLSWVGQGLGMWWRQGSSHASQPKRAVRWLLVTLPVAGFTVSYAISWGMFLSSGRFANVETGRFVLFNLRHLWHYVTAAEPSQLAALTVAALLGLWAVPCFLWWGTAPQQQTCRLPVSPAARLLAWAGVTLTVMVFWQYLPVHESVLRRATRMHVLRYGLNPTFTLYVSQVEASLLGRVHPTLDTNLLQKIDNSPQAPWNQPPVWHGSAASDQQPPAVIVVAIESLRQDVVYQHHAGLEIMPNLNRLARQGLQLTRAFSESTHSDYADPCLVSSLYPLRTLRHHYYSASDPWPRTLIYDRLRPLGYSTAIISSQNEAWGGMNHFLQTPNLDLFYHPETVDGPTLVSNMDPGFSREVSLGALVAGKFPDGHTTDIALEWIRKQVRDGRPYFLSMNLQSSHFPYLMPESVPRPFQPCALDPNISFVDYPRDQVDAVRNAYFNAIHECDRQLGRLVATLQELGQLENTILVVTGENGEAFHECGQVAHAREPVKPAIHVACVIHAPGRVPAQVDDYPFEHVDIAPTVCGMLGLPSHPNFQGIDYLSTSRPPREERLTFCHVITGLAYVDAILLAGRWKLAVDRRTGDVSLHDLEEDPDERHNLVSRHPALVNDLRSKLEEWRRQQLTYYEFPAYYLNYYPPRPPAWKPADRAVTVRADAEVY